MNGREIPPLGQSNPSLGVVVLGFGPAGADAARAEFVTWVTREAGMVFRNSGCGSASLVSPALGHADGYISLGESSWDVMAALAIIAQLGGESTVDSSGVGLRSKFLFPAALVISSLSHQSSRPERRGLAPSIALPSPGHRSTAATVTPSASGNQLLPWSAHPEGRAQVSRYTT